MTFMLVIEDGTEDTLSTENVASMQLLVCLDAIEDTTKTTNAKERIKKKHKQNAAQLHNLVLEIVGPPRASTRHLKCRPD